MTGTDHPAETAAMPAQAKMYSVKMYTIRIVASYATSILLAIIGAALIVLAPESRTVAANISATALLVLAIGIAGFTKFQFEAQGIKLGADTRPPSKQD